MGLLPTKNLPQNEKGIRERDKRGRVRERRAIITKQREDEEETSASLWQKKDERNTSSIKTDHKTARVRERVGK